VMESRRKLTEILSRLYAATREEQEATRMWNEYRTSLPYLFSMVKVSHSAVNPLSIDIDREESRRRLTEYQGKQRERQSLRSEVAVIEAEMLDAMIDYADVYH